MIWFIVGYFVVAIIANALVSYTIAVKLHEKAPEDKGLRDYLFNKHFKNSGDWLEKNLQLPAIFHPLIKQVFFPFNVATLIRCYRSAIAELNDIRGQNRE